MVNKVTPDISNMPSSDRTCEPASTSGNQEGTNRKKVRKMLMQSLAFAGMVNQMSGYTDTLFPEEESNETIDGGD